MQGVLCCRAERGILFFDEADAMFGKQSEVKDGHDRCANIEIYYTLQEMEDDWGFAILSTNIRSLLDQAFICCLSFQVEFLLTRCPTSSENLSENFAMTGPAWLWTTLITVGMKVNNLSREI